MVMTDRRAQSRTEVRQSWAIPTRVSALEQDADQADDRHDALVGELQAIKGRLTGILCAIVGSVGAGALLAFLRGN